MKLNKYIDHTLLKQDATENQIDCLLSEAREYDFASVCVNPTWVEHAKKGLEGTDVKVCTVVGFPLGATTSAVKSFETKEAIQNGADEIDMVINVGALKTGNLDLVESDIRAVVEASGDKLVKVIIEACLLTDQEKVVACQLAQKAGADFIVICTNTMHKVVSGIKKYTKLPILHIAEMTAIELKKAGIKKIGLLGTKYTMQQDFYKQILIDNGIEVVIPNSKDIEIVNSVIFNELCLGKIKKESKDKYLRIIENLSKDGVEGIILGCTEIGLLVKQEDTDIPLFDTTSIHATSAALYAIEEK